MTRKRKLLFHNSQTRYPIQPEQIQIFVSLDDILCNGKNIMKIESGDGLKWLIVGHYTFELDDQTLTVEKHGKTVQKIKNFCGHIVFDQLGRYALLHLVRNKTVS
jgi:hypothetical protein